MKAQRNSHASGSLKFTWPPKAAARTRGSSVELEALAAFEREELDPQTLLGVLTTKGRATLDAALKEATGAPMGHRMKIMTVLERGGGGEGLELD